MSNLTGLQNGVFNTLQLIDDTTGDSTEVRQLFLQGTLEQTIPNNPLNNQVLSIPGLLPELNARQLISNSYSKTEVNSLIQNNPGPKGAKGDKGTSIKGSKGLKGDTGPSSTGTKGQKGEQGSIGQKGELGGLGSKGQKGSQGTQGAKGDVGSGSKGQKGEPGAATNTSLFRLISDSYSRTEIDAVNAAQSAGINQNAQNQISNQLGISQNQQDIINLQVAVSMLQVADNGINAQLNTINATLTSLQNQINALPAPLKVESGGTQYVPKILTLQGSGIGSVGWFPTPAELVFSFQ